MIHPLRSRRALLVTGTLGLTGCLLQASAVRAQPTWPAKPVRLVVAFPPGGLADVMARVLQPQLSEALAQPVVVDNRAGAGGNVAGVEVIRNGGDGHTFLVTVSTTQSVNPLLFNPMPFDAQRDLQPVGLLANSQLFLVTRPGLPVRTVRELVAYAKANPGKLSYGSAGNGTTPHLAGELFKQNAGFFATHIPYRGAAPAIQDVMAGVIDFAFAPGTVFSSVRAGRLNLLAVASRQRAASYPDAPTFTEMGVGNVFADTLFGVYAPMSTAPEAVNRMNRELNRLLSQPVVKSRFGELGADAQPMSAAEFRSLVQSEAHIFAGAVKASGIKAD